MQEQNRDKVDEEKVRAAEVYGLFQFFAELVPFGHSRLSESTCCSSIWRKLVLLSSVAARGHIVLILIPELLMTLDPLFNLNRFAQALIETLEELSTVLFRDCLDKSTQAINFDVPFLELLLHFFDMHPLVIIQILVAELLPCLGLYKLKVPSLGLRLGVDQFTHLVDHLLVLRQKLGPVVDLLLQVALRGHKDPALLVVEDADWATNGLLE